MKIYMNGKFCDKEDAKVSVFDHGLLYGDGVFEGIRAYGRRVFKLREHIVRLYESAHTIMLHIPMTHDQMVKAVVSTLKANNLDNAYIRLVVTRGEGDLGLDPRKCTGGPTVIIITDNIKMYPEKFYKEGLSIITVPTVRNLTEALNPQVKSLNYLNNIMAKIEATNVGYEEAIMLNSLGYVSECTGDNFFVIKKGHLYTPPQCMGTLRGITRDAVIEIAAKNKVLVHEHVMTRHEIFNSDEAFLTGTAAEIVPVVKVDGRCIGSGKPGPLTLKLLKHYKDLTKVDGVTY
ncbi:MAG TPA: branched-chain-amino-acid transaminase [Candidatus Omnitrophota bacterium]|nr:branched-chain-amino-acid transaminase [Candidatus Omnitrophota bacterium]HNX82519.1 branched-chain-amino-acid transaminase [Candidatus Omnitrophota bacterium]HPT07363.1 branched-chain-amino-acid transaminase [Candidatus Omnitrophota bacterium]